MILDALLKTKSRTVLVDIINKNGNHSVFFFFLAKIFLYNIFNCCFITAGFFTMSGFWSIGLQMLHNIMKRYRKEFNKTPILRKLLKVNCYCVLVLVI